MKKQLTILAFVLSALANAQSNGDPATFFYLSPGIKDTKVYTARVNSSLYSINGSGNFALLPQSTFLTPAQGNSAYQPLNATLTALAALSTTSYGRGLLVLVDGPAVRTYIGAGTGSGSVTSVDITGANGITSSGGPINTAGSITVGVNANNLSTTLDGATDPFLRTSAGTSGYVPLTRTISTTSPITGGGDLSANRTIAIADAAANGTTKGAATFTASDFNSLAGVIGIDYTNAQKATVAQPGLLTASDWFTFNGKQGAITFGIGVQTALGVNIGSAGAPVLFNGAGGTPSSITLTNATGTAASLTAGTASAVAVGGITGLGSGIGTWLATPSSANLRSGLTDENGTGAALFDGATSPTFVTPALGTPSALVGTNITGTASGLSIGGNAATATALQTGRTINGTTFDGTGNITVTSAAGTLTGTTLNSSVVTSSLTSAAGGSFGTAAYVNTGTSGANVPTITDADARYQLQSKEEIIVLDADFVNNSAAYTNVLDGSANALSITLDANSTYFFEGRVVSSTPSASTGVGYALTMTGSPTTRNVVREYLVATAQANALSQALNVDDTYTTVTSYTASTKLPTMFNGLIVTSGSACTITLRVIRGGTSNNVTTYAGSFLKATKLP